MFKTLAEYISAAGGNHEAAAAALHADLVTTNADKDREAGANIRARTIVKHLEPLAEALGIPLPAAGARPTQDAETALADGVKDALEGVEALESSVEAWQSIAADAGLDIEALEKLPEKEQDAFIQNFISGLDSSTTQQELAVYKFAAANGLNPQAVMLQKGLEGLTEREVKQTVDGKESTVKVWGIPGKDDAFTPALDHLKPVMAALKPADSKPTGTSWIGGQENQSKPGGLSVYEQYKQDKAKQDGQASGYVDPLRAPSAVPSNPATSTTNGGQN